MNPERLEGDPDLETLIARVPFGVPEELPPHRPVLPSRENGERRILFGGLYDWYDPWTLLDALARLDVPNWTLLLIRNPNADSTPQRLLGEVERAAGSWAGGGAACGRSTGSPPTGVTTCCGTWTCWSRRIARAWRPASRCAPASSTPWPPAARW